MWWKMNKWKVIVPVLVVAILAGAFWYGGGAPGMQGWTVDPDETISTEHTPNDSTTPDQNVTIQTTPDPSPGQTAAPETPAPTPANTLEPTPKPTPEPTPEPTSETGIESRPGGLEGGMSVQEKLDAAAAMAGGSSAGVEAGNTDYSQQQGMVIDPNTGKDKYLTDPVPEGKPIPVEPQDVTISDVTHTCTISISCATILDNMGWLDPEKTELVPEDGWILQPTQVTFYEGESVFNVLQRICKQMKIHMEFENTPMYNSAYIEGIHNLYEFDCGELSGWMYKVNEWFPNYGCSRYQLKEGDVICWVYTCNLGVDVGGYSAAGG